jgi:hypothetical protein
MRYHLTRRAMAIAAIAMLAAADLPADFSYQETSTVTGGALAAMMKVAGVFSRQAREPIRSTVAVKGDRMTTRTPTQSTMVDLAAETITTIDLERKTYTVMTFEEMRQMLAQMSQKMKGKGQDSPQMDFKVSASNTGKTRQVAGFNTKELILKMEMQSTDPKNNQQGSMVITTDMWIAPPVPGYAEVRDFQRRMAEKLNWAPGGNMFMNNPEVMKGMAEVMKEIGKLDGMPVLQNVVMGAAGAAEGGSVPAAPASQTQPAAAQPQAESSSGAPAARLGGALGGALGRFGGLGRKKQPKQEAPAEQPAQPASQPAQAQGGSAPGSLLEMQTEQTGFSSAAVDASQFEVPAGFKKVQKK